MRRRWRRTASARCQRRRRRRRRRRNKTPNIHSSSSSPSSPPSSSSTFSFSFSSQRARATAHASVVFGRVGCPHLPPRTTRCIDADACEEEVARHFIQRFAQPILQRGADGEHGSVRVCGQRAGGGDVRLRGRSATDPLPFPPSLRLSRLRTVYLPYLQRSPGDSSTLNRSSPMVIAMACRSVIRLLSPSPPTPPGNVTEESRDSAPRSAAAPTRIAATLFWQLYVSVRVSQGSAPLKPTASTSFPSAKRKKVEGRPAACARR